jgi:tRNA threonylcarbamoyladenosine biosynthesis protein TsaE
MPPHQTLITASEQDTRHQASRLSPELLPGTILLISGELGVGKTVFVRGIAQGLGIDPDEVTSPTFTLVHEYRGGRLPLIHVDLYRLDNAELDEIGLDSELAASGVTAIEWPERLVRQIPDAIRIELMSLGEDRVITIHAKQRFRFAVN